MTEALQIPKQVINADWKDDIDYETYGDDEQEMEYVSPDKVSKASIEKIKSRDLRPTFKERGSKVSHLFHSIKLLA